MNTLIIGTGRLAAGLCNALKEAGFPLTGVAGRNRERVQELASANNARPFALDDDLPAADLTLIAVSDDAIASVASRLKKVDGIVAHTSGASPIDLLLPNARRGVFWPVQSFMEGSRTRFTDVPLVIEGSDGHVASVLNEVAMAIGARVIGLSHEERRKLHLAAVFAGNFPVALMQAAQRYLKKEGLPDDLLMELWKTTAANVAAMGPEKALTGPAKRGDRITMERHLDLLRSEPGLAGIYQQISALIAKDGGS